MTDKISLTYAGAMMRLPTVFLPLLLILSLLCVASCNHKNKEKEPTPTVEELYSRGMSKFEKKEYKGAIEAFDQLENDYPYSSWAVNAEIMEAYSYYVDKKYADVVSVTDRFIKMHPGNKNIAYIYYLRALSYYEQISDTGRDQKATQLALGSLKEVVARFPASDYARDARVKIDLVNDHLAGKEMEIGRFYLKSGKTLAAVNRFRTVANQYQTTSHVPEALYRLTAGYMTLGVKSEAERNAAVLGYNYPASKWYHYSYDVLEGKPDTH